MAAPLVHHKFLDTALIAVDQILLVDLCRTVVHTHCLEEKLLLALNDHDVA